MLILFDQNTPRGVATALSSHQVTTAFARGWERLSNGELLAVAEEAGVDLLLTGDRRIRYQHNLAGRKIAIVVLRGATKWTRVRLCLEQISLAIETAAPGSYTEVEIPFR